MAVCILLAWMWLVICIIVSTAETHYPQTLFIFTHFLDKILLLQEFITIQTTCVSIADNKTINFKYSFIKIWLIWTKKSVKLKWLTILLLFIVVSHMWRSKMKESSTTNFHFLSYHYQKFKNIFFSVIDTFYTLELNYFNHFGRTEIVTMDLGLFLI